LDFRHKGSGPIYGDIAVSLASDLSRCDAEIEDKKRGLRNGEYDDHPGGALLGLHDWIQERKEIMAEIEQKEPEKVVLAGGTFTSSKIPRFDLIPRQSLVRLSGRFEMGVVRHKEKAWNASKPQHPALLDKEAIIARASHAIDHASKLIAILTGQMTDDGDDHAAAVMWAGSFLCESAEKSMRIPLS
jgi:hypothetical protein